jgi:hypothetical protein
LCVLGSFISKKYFDSSKFSGSIIFGARKGHREQGPRERTTYLYDFLGPKCDSCLCALPTTFQVLRSTRRFPVWLWIPELRVLFSLLPLQRPSHRWTWLLNHSMATLYKYPLTAWRYVDVHTRRICAIHKLPNIGSSCSATSRWS